MLKFALKNMAIKKVKIILIVLSIVISATVGILAYNISGQVNDGIKNTAAYYDLIVGPSGSSTQLAMNTMFFTDKPLGTISYEYFEQLQNDSRVNVAVPFTMGDSYRSARIVGTSSDFLSDKELSQGHMFTDTYEAVVGYTVAKSYNIKVGDSLVTSHGLSEGGHTHESSPLKVVGILDKTSTAYDNVIFTTVETTWATHDHSEHEEGETHEDGDEHHEGEICAILVKSKNLTYSMNIQSELSENASLLVINPSEVLREVLDNVDFSSKIVYILCIIIVIMNIFIISVITLLNMYDSKSEISLMRLIGIGMGKINLLYIIQNAIIGLFSTILAFLASRLCLLLMSSFVASMGIVLTVSKVYPFEWIIMLIVFIISVLPTVICTLNMSKKDSLEG